VAAASVAAVVRVAGYFGAGSRSGASSNHTCYAPLCRGAGTGEGVAGIPRLVALDRVPSGWLLIGSRSARSAALDDRLDSNSPRFVVEVVSTPSALGLTGAVELACALPVTNPRVVGGAFGVVPIESLRTPSIVRVIPPAHCDPHALSQVRVHLAAAEGSVTLRVWRPPTAQR
jgi:hypothetical protein